VNERPRRLALKAYENMLSYHSTVIGGSDDLGQYRDDRTIGMPEVPAESASRNAHKVRKLAAKLIKAWHKDVATRVECEAAQEAAIKARFGRAR